MKARLRVSSTAVVIGVSEESAVSATPVPSSSGVPGVRLIVKVAFHCGIARACHIGSDGEVDPHDHRGDARRRSSGPRRLPGLVGRTRPALELGAQPTLQLPESRHGERQRDDADHGRHRLVHVENVEVLLGEHAPKPAD